MNIKKELQNKIKDFLQNKAEINFAYIFGSFVQKDYFHDIDVAVYLKDDFNKNDHKKFPFGYESFMISELIQLSKKISIW